MGFAENYKLNKEIEAYIMANYKSHIDGEGNLCVEALVNACANDLHNEEAGDIHYDIATNIGIKLELI